MPEYIDLRPGQRISVQRDAGALDDAFTSTIRHVSPVAVRIDIPRRGDVRLELQPDTDLLIMVDLQGRLYTFATHVQKYEATTDTVIVDRPRIVEQSERRQFFRLAINIRPRYAAVMDAKGNERRRLEVMILDISGGGLQLRSKQLVEPGDWVHLVFPLGNDELETDTYALSASPLEGELPWMFRVNARFANLSRQTQERIIRFIFKQQIDFMKRGVR